MRRASGVPARRIVEAGRVGRERAALWNMTIVKRWGASGVAEYA